MICSARELGLGEDHDGIIVLQEWFEGDEEVLGALKPGDDAISLLGLDDEVVEVTITPDRGYCFSLRGIAREYGHATGGAFRDPAALTVDRGDGPGYPVEVADEAPLLGRVGCDRYVARVIRGVDASRPSPHWMQKRLTQSGMRPISLAVDVTNYVMLALGQPLHAFDVAGLSGSIVVRRARAGRAAHDAGRRPAHAAPRGPADHRRRAGAAGHRRCHGRCRLRGHRRHDRHPGGVRALRPDDGRPVLAPPQAGHRGVQALRAGRRRRAGRGCRPAGREPAAGARWGSARRGRHRRRPAPAARRRSGSTRRSRPGWWGCRGPRRTSSTRCARSAATSTTPATATSPCCRPAGAPTCRTAPTSPRRSPACAATTRSRPCCPRPPAAAG